MPIWISPRSLEQITEFSCHTASGHLGMRFTGIGDDWIEGELPFDSRTQSEAGTLHHGSLAILAETLGSVGASMCVDASRHICLGQILHLQHPAAAVRGPLRGRATPLARDDAQQLWEIQIRDGNGTRVCIAQLTVVVLDRPPRPPA